MGSWLLLLVLGALGFAMVRAIWPAPRAWSAADPLRVAVAPALGLGVGSLLYFLLRVVLRQPPMLVIGAVVLATAAAGGIAWMRGGSAAADEAAPRGTTPVWLWLLFGAAGALAFFTFLMLTAAAPHGEWDAWSIWTLRARFLFRAQEFTSPFSPAIAWSHPDYPLLVPGAVALLWHAGAGESLRVAAFAGFAFLSSAVAVPYFVLRLLRGPALAALCALCILGATSLVRVGASLYADVPLASLIVVAAALLVYGLERGKAGPVALAAMAAGLAAWTKNEGLLFCVSLTLAHLISVQSVAEWRRRAQFLVPFAAGLGPVLGVVFYFKTRIAPANDLINAATGSLLQTRILEFNRYWMTFWSFVGESLTFGNALVPPVIVFSVWLALVRMRQAVGGAHLVPLITAGLQLAGYFAVYVISPADLDWQLNTSLPRLLLHVWPLFVCGVFLISKDIFGEEPQPARGGTRSK